MDPTQHWAVLSDSERSRRRRLFESHESLIAAAREFGGALARHIEGPAAGPEDLDELEDSAGRLDEAALAYGRARRAIGPCGWRIGDLMMADGAGADPEPFLDCSGALYEAAEAVAEMTDVGPPGAVEAARTIMGQVAYRFYEASCRVVSYTATLVSAAS